MSSRSLSVLIVVTLACTPVPEKCSASTCAGCCDLSGQCQGGSLDSACGRGGAMCASCFGNQRCEASACVASFVGTGGGSAGGSSAGGSVAGGSTSGGNAGGSIAGGSAGGSVAGGTAGGSSGGGSAGGSSAGGLAGAGGTAGPGGCSAVPSGCATMLTWTTGTSVGAYTNTPPFEYTTFQSRSSSAATYALLTVGLFWATSAGSTGLTVPSTRDLSLENGVNTCRVCTTVQLGCNQGTCVRRLFARRGTLVLNTASRNMFGTFDATLDNACFEEWDMTTDRAVPNGQCLRYVSTSTFFTTW